jgi:hypothetical protein
MTQAGTNFHSQEFRDYARSVNSEVKLMPVEAHNSIGKVERYHTPLRRAYRILSRELPDLGEPRTTPNGPESCERHGGTEWTRSNTSCVWMPTPEWSRTTLQLLQLLYEQLQLRKLWRTYGSATPFGRSPTLSACGMDQEPPIFMTSLSILKSWYGETTKDGKDQ